MRIVGFPNRPKLVFVIGVITVAINLVSSYSGAQTNAAEVVVCSFNIRYSNDHDGANQWIHRKEWVADFIQFFDVDVVGMQEVQNDQKDDLDNLLPGYESIGVSSDPGKPTGEYEYNAIYYRPDRLKLLNQGDFWLSDTPERPSKGWDAIFQRMVTWGQFETLSGKSFFLFNTHFSHVGENARNNSARVMREMMAEIAGDAPVIAMGDFNAQPGTQAIKTMTGKDSGGRSLVDARFRSKSSYGPNFTFNCFGGCDVLEGRVIDFIFVSDQVQVESHAILTEKRGEVYISDHYPLLAEVAFEE